jgi:hypothetical protein
MKAIFLDIEGVIVSHRSILVQTSQEHGEMYTSSSPGWHRFVDSVAMRLVIDLAMRSDSKIVLTSTLRDEPNIVAALEGMCMRYASHKSKDEDGTDLIAGVTGHGSCREQEIAGYVHNHDVSQYVVLDDRRLSCPNFVWVDPREGLTYANFQQCKPFLAPPDDGNIEARNEFLRPELIFL